jgi:hypothetical protein
MFQGVEKVFTCLSPACRNASCRAITTDNQLARRHHGYPPSNLLVVVHEADSISFMVQEGTARVLVPGNVIDMIGFIVISKGEEEGRGKGGGKGGRGIIEGKE